MFDLINIKRLHYVVTYTVFQKTFPTFLTVTWKPIIKLR